MGDFGDQLSEEILSEMAGQFFGLRKQVDDMLEIFTDSVHKLQIQELEIVRKLAFLHHLLLQGKGTDAFFRALGVDFPAPSAGFEKTLPPVGIPKTTGWAFSTQQRYLKLVFQAYVELHMACRIYRVGDSRTDPSPKADPDGPVSYQLILDMAQLINAEIEKVNNSNSPSCALDFVKRLNVAESEKEQFTGVIFERHGHGLDDALCFSPVDINTLPITAYPDLPDPKLVKKEIYLFCKAFYTENRSQILCMIKEVTKRSP